MSAPGTKCGCGLRRDAAGLCPGGCDAYKRHGPKWQASEERRREKELRKAARDHEALGITPRQVRDAAERVIPGESAVRAAGRARQARGMRTRLTG